MSLAKLAEARLRSGLQSIIDEWAPGKDLPRKLLTGRDMALAAIRRYRPNLRYDPSRAAEQMRDIEAWAGRNQTALEAIMASTEQQLPDKLQLEMGADRAQAFVVASFTQAAAGLGAWASGQVARAHQQGALTENWARADAQQRLEMFALIVKLDRQGSLEAIFTPPDQAAAGGLGAIPLWFVAVVLVIVAAAVVTAVVLVRRLELNNQLLADLCKDALARGDKEAYDKCLETTAGLQTTPLEELPTKVAYAVVAGALVYGLARWGIPWVASTARGQRVSEAATRAAERGGRAAEAGAGKLERQWGSAP